MVLTDTKHIENHDQNEGNETEEGGYIRQEALRRVHLVEHVGETSREEYRRRTVEHDETTKGQ